MNSLLIPERLAGESLEAYRDRRQTAADYVAANTQGDLQWSPRDQGPFVNEAKQQERVFGKGKVGRKMLKQAKRLLRQQPQPQQ